MLSDLGYVTSYLIFCPLELFPVLFSSLPDYLLAPGFINDSLELTSVMPVYCSLLIVVRSGLAGEVTFIMVLVAPA